MKDNRDDGTERAAHYKNGSVSRRQEETVAPVRIDGKYILGEIGSILNFKKGLPYTIKELLFRPGISVMYFLSQDRRKLVSPVLFVIFCSFVYTILQQFLNFEDGYSQEIADKQDSTMLVIIRWIQGNYGYANILMSLLVVPWLQLFFRKYGYNYFETLILVLYVFGMVMLISALFGILDVFLDVDLYGVSGFIGFAYASWAFGQFFNSRVAWSYIKSFLAYVLGLTTSIVLAFLIGFLVDQFF